MACSGDLIPSLDPCAPHTNPRALLRPGGQTRMGASRQGARGWRQAIRWAGLNLLLVHTLPSRPSACSACASACASLPL